MARIVLADDITQDFVRIVDHLLNHDVLDPALRLEEVIAALDILEHSPLIGRPVEGDLRELVIGRGSRGYVALYRYVPEMDFAFVLAIRSQREAGYKR